MLPCLFLGPQCPERGLPSSRRCPVHKCLLEENKEAGMGWGKEGGRKKKREWRREGGKVKGRKEAVIGTQPWASN